MKRSDFIKEIEILIGNSTPYIFSSKLSDISIAYKNYIKICGIMDFWNKNNRDKIDCFDIHKDYFYFLDIMRNMF